MKNVTVVIGATGNVGGDVARRLLARKRAVRAIGRTSSHLKPLADLGAEIAAGSVEDARFLRQAFDGATEAFVMVPPNLASPDVRAYQRRSVDSLVSSVASARIGRVVALSSIGADLPAGTGPIAGLYDLERGLAGLENTVVTVLRPGFFLENHLAGIPMMKSQGIYGSALLPEIPLAMVATRDIGAVAAEILDDASDGRSSIREIHGARDYTMTEATAALGAAVGKPGIRYVSFPYDATRQALVGMGLSDSMADLYVEMARALNEGLVKPLEPRSPSTSTSTTLEEFAAAVFAKAFRAD